jgi:DHA2 family methylenomycin A resistance protein-like MFS transporter
MKSAESFEPSIPAFPGNSLSPWKVFFACILASLATIFAPPLLRMFRAHIWSALDMSEVQWAVALAIRGFVLILFVLVGGAIGDVFGQRRVLILALWSYILSSALTALAPSSSVFVVASTLMSVTGAIVKVLSLTLMLIAFDRRQRIFALVVYSVIVLLGYVLSPLMAREIGQNADARYMYALPTTLGVLALGLAIKYVPPSSLVRAKVMDVLTMNLWIAGLCGVIFALVLAGIVGWTNIWVLFILGTGIVIMVGVDRFERIPLGDERWRYHLGFKRQLGVAIVAGVMLNLVLYSVTAQIYSFLNRVQNYDLLAAAIRLAPVLVGAVVFGAIAAQLTIRLGARNALSLGLLVTAAAATGFSLLQPNLPYWILALLLVAVGFGFILGNTPRLLLLNAAVPYGLIATAQAIGSATAQLGGALAYALMLYLTQGFGLQVLTGLVQGSGLNVTEAALQLESLSVSVDSLSLLQTSPVQMTIAERLVPGFHLAYTKGLSQAMLVLAGVCVVAAVLVQVVLLGTSASNTEGDAEPVAQKSF